MVNPFKSGDKVLTLRKGIEIEATVRTTWNHEVQVRAADGELLWRTMKTIRSVAPPATDQPAETPQNFASGTEVTQAEPPVEPASGEPTSGQPVSEEPVIVEPASQSTGEPTDDPVTVEPAGQEPESTVEPDSEEPASGEPAASEPVTVEPAAEVPANEESPAPDQPAEPEQQQSGKGKGKPKKGRKGILRKLMFDDNFDD